MNIRRKLIQVSLLICLSGFYFSCVDPFPELPPETQSGAGTFGCLVNNELVFAESKSSWQGMNAEASYNQNNDELTIIAQCQFGQQFIFLINDPYKKKDSLIDSISYLPPNSKEWMKANQTGNFRITRIDIYKEGFEVVSGNFFFSINEHGKTPVHITKGRFDLNLIFN